MHEPRQATLTRISWHLSQAMAVATERGSDASESEESADVLSGKKRKCCERNVKLQVRDFRLTSPARWRA
jgi:hypothetical protein